MRFSPDMIRDDLRDGAAIEIDEQFPVAIRSTSLEACPTMTSPMFLVYKQQEAAAFVKTNFQLRHVSKPMRIAIRNNIRLAKVLKHTLSPKTV